MSPSTEPGYWMHETTGVLRPAVEAYLLGGELSPEHCAALRAYIRQWMATDWQGEEIDQLRRRVDTLTTRPAIECWLNDALYAGIDPF